MNPCLVILNPRRIPEVLEAVDALDVPKLWLTGYTENDLKRAFPAAVDSDDAEAFSHFVTVSDDVVVPPAALAELLKWVRRSSSSVVTGFCNVDENSHSHLVNLTHGPLPSERPNVDAYSFRSADEVAHARTPLVRTWFAGMTLTCMPKVLWRKFPFGVYRGQRGKGFGSDYHLSWRLQEARVNILAPRLAVCRHLKREWNEQDPRWELFPGDMGTETRWELG